MQHRSLIFLASETVRCNCFLHSSLHFFQYGRKATIEVDLDTVQLGLIQLANNPLVFNFVVKYIYILF